MVVSNSYFELLLFLLLFTLFMVRDVSDSYVTLNAVTLNAVTQNAVTQYAVTQNATH